MRQRLYGWQSLKCSLCDYLQTKFSYCCIRKFSEDFVLSLDLYDQQVRLKFILNLNLKTNNKVSPPVGSLPCHFTVLSIRLDITLFSCPSLILWVGFNYYICLIICNDLVSKISNFCVYYFL